MTAMLGDLWKGGHPRDPDRYEVRLGDRTLHRFGSWARASEFVKRSNHRRRTTLRNHHPDLDWYRVVDTEVDP